MKRTDILSRRTIRERVTLFLNVLREISGDEVDIGMTQEKLAQYLCVDRSSLSEELNIMRREGLIDFRKKNLFTTEFLWYNALDFERGSSRMVCHSRIRNDAIMRFFNSTVGRGL
jgi:hypothetical protein